MRNLAVVEGWVGAAFTVLHIVVRSEVSDEVLSFGAQILCCDF
jgi:hypothetical protein